MDCSIFTYLQIDDQPSNQTTQQNIMGLRWYYYPRLCAYFGYEPLLKIPPNLMGTTHSYDELVPLEFSRLNTFQTPITFTSYSLICSNCGGVTQPLPLDVPMLNYYIFFPIPTFLRTSLSVSVSERQSSWPHLPWDCQWAISLNLHVELLKENK